MLIQLYYERPFVTMADLVEWLNSFSQNTSNHHRGFDSQKLVSLFLFVERMDFRFSCFLFVCCFFFVFVFCFFLLFFLEKGAWVQSPPEANDIWKYQIKCYHFHHMGPEYFFFTSFEAIIFFSTPLEPFYFFFLYFKNPKYMREIGFCS